MRRVYVLYILLALWQLGLEILGVSLIEKEGDMSFAAFTDIQGRFARNHTYLSVGGAGDVSLSFDNSFVVVPARNEADTVGWVLKGLLADGVPPEQILVVDSSSFDDTAKIAADHGVVVIDQMKTIDRHCRRDAFLDLGISFNWSNKLPDMDCGKGCAIFAALLYLGAIGAADDTRIFLLDADIRNLQELNPLRYLVFADEDTDGRLSCIKCGHPKRENEIPLAMWVAAAQTFPAQAERYLPVSAFTWPLCGQMMVRLGALRKTPIASGYSLETVMLMGLLDLVGIDGLGQVWVHGALEDKVGDPPKYIMMYGKIGVMIMRVLQREGGLPGILESGLYTAFNDSLREANAFVTSPDGPNIIARAKPEKLIPPFEFLREACAITFA
ncbi:hypothetical protein CL629_03285 [bacterium]|nr:hypothetical protein [bacterium]